MSFAGIQKVRQMGVCRTRAHIEAGETLASAGDDGNVLIWMPVDKASWTPAYEEDYADYLEFWRVKTMCRSNMPHEVYDLAWSPDGTFFVTGSMDNVARIYNATHGEWLYNSLDLPLTKQEPVSVKSPSTITSYKALPGIRLMSSSQRNQPIDLSIFTLSRLEMVNCQHHSTTR